MVLPGVPQAQQFPSLGVSSYAGQKVSSVDIAGRPDVSFDSVAHDIAVEPNKPLSADDVDASVAALKHESGVRDVRIDLQPSAEGVQVTFILAPAMYVGMYEFPGALKEFSYTRLLQVANYNAQMPYSATDIAEAEDALVKFYRQQGYFKAEVRSELSEDKEHDLVDVLFRTYLGKRAKFGQINLQGATPEETAYLQKKLRSVMARLRGDSLKPGMTYSYWRLQGATKYMQSALGGQNYIAGSVKLISAEYDPNTNRADITFHVETGPVVKVATTGAHIWKRTLRNLVPVYAENSVNDELIREGQQNILGYFQKKGYFDAKVDVTQKQTPQGMEIIYDIHKDSRFKVKEVAFKGNHHLSSKELHSHVSVEKASWLFLSHGTYSQQLVRASVKNLTDTYHAAGYSEAQVVPNVSANDGKVNIVFQVTEGPLTTVRNLTIEGNNTVAETQFAPHGLNLGPGKAYSQDLLAKDRSLIMAHYLTSGYLNAGFKASAKPVPGTPHEMDVVYQISEGPQVRTATVITDGRGHTQQSLINRQVKISPISRSAITTCSARRAACTTWTSSIGPRWIPGALSPIRPAKTWSSRCTRASATPSSTDSAFRCSIVEARFPSGTVAVPGLPPVGLPSNFKTSQKTYWGPDGTFEYTRRNMRGRAETLNFSAFAGRLDQRGSLDLHRSVSVRDASGAAARFSPASTTQRIPSSPTRLGSVGYQLQRPLARRRERKQRRIFHCNTTSQLTRISNLLIPELVPAQSVARSSLHLVRKLGA